MSEGGSSNGSAPPGHWMAPKPPPPDRKARLRVVGLAAVGAVVGWAAIHLIGGIRLSVKLSADAATGIVGPVGVALVAFIAGLAAWGLLALLEHVTAQARTIWRFLATAVLLVSLTAPLGAGTTTSAKVSLAALHVAVGAVLIPGLARTSRRA
ncbi:MAG TPA: DUF6069 family protein [Actinomycetota bacterium]|nr:DUF6069 family protein [Actinomycetota bacterium]